MTRLYLQPYKRGIIQTTPSIVCCCKRCPLENVGSFGCTFLTRLIYSSGYKGSNPWLMFHFQHHLSYLSCKLSWIVLCIATDGDSPERRCHGSGNGSVLMISTTHPAMQRGIHLLRCRSYSHLLLYYKFVRFWTCQLAYATHVEIGFLSI